MESTDLCKDCNFLVTTICLNCFNLHILHLPTLHRYARCWAIWRLTVWYWQCGKQHEVEVSKSVIQSRPVWDHHANCHLKWLQYPSSTLCVLYVAWFHFPQSLQCQTSLHPCYPHHDTIKLAYLSSSCNTTSTTCCLNSECSCCIQPSVYTHYRQKQLYEIFTELSSDAFPLTLSAFPRWVLLFI